MSFLHWLPALAWAALIFFLSHQSSPPGASLLPDFVGHYLVYFVFGVTLVRGWTAGWKESFHLRGALFLWFLAALYAVSDEVHQSFIPDRFPSVSDLVVDVVAAGTAIFLLQRFLPARNGKR